MLYVVRRTFVLLHNGRAQRCAHFCVRSHKSILQRHLPRQEQRLRRRRAQTGGKRTVAADGGVQRSTMMMGYRECDAVHGIQSNRQQAGAVAPPPPQRHVFYPVSVDIISCLVAARARACILLGVSHMELSYKYFDIYALHFSCTYVVLVWQTRPVRASCRVVSALCD